MSSKLLCVAGMSAFLSICCLCSFGQPMDGPGGPGGPGGPEGGQEINPNVPPEKPVEPVRPVAPVPLELPMDWLESRKLLLDVCDSVLDDQFKDIRSSTLPAFSPLVQQFREYISEKSIVTLWSETRPLGIEWTYPVPAPKETIKEIRTRLEWQLTREAEEKFPLLTREEYVRQAEEKYRMFRVREMVEVPLLQGGRGVMRRRRGRLLRVSNGQVRLAPRIFISRQDMSDEVAARFFRDVHVRKVKEYADNAEKNCQLNRRNYIQVNLTKRFKEKLLENNYVPNFVEHYDTVSTSIFKIDHWCSRRELVLKYQLLLWRRGLGPKSMRERMQEVIAGTPQSRFKLIGTHIQEEFMHRHGFVLLNKQEADKLGLALRQDEVNRHIGWVLQKDVYAMEQWLVRRERYEKEKAEYDDKKAEYDRAMITYKKHKEAYDRAQEEAAAAGGGEDEEEEEE